MTTTAARSTTWTIGNVSLFDGVDVLGRVVLTVEGDTIRSLAPERAGITAYDVDGAGGWLLPGLVDAHVHVTSPADLELFAAHGITTVLDMATHDAAGFASCATRSGAPTCAPPAPVPVPRAGSTPG